MFHSKKTRLRLTLAVSGVLLTGALVAVFVFDLPARVQQTRADLLNMQGMGLLLQGDQPGARAKFEAALVIYQQLDNPLLESAVLSNLGQVYGAMGQTTTSLEYFQRALALAEESGDENTQGRILSYRGLTHAHLGQLQSGLADLQRALTLLEPQMDQVGVGEAHHAISLVYGGMGEYQAALDHAQQALTLAQKTNHLLLQVSSLLAIATLQATLGEDEVALDHAQQALTLAQQTGNRVGEGQAHTGLGALYAYFGQFSQGLQHFQQALSIQTAMNDRAGQAITLYNIGSIYGDQGRSVEALDLLQQALAIHQAIDNRAGESLTLSGIGLLHMRLGQYEEALDLLQRAQEIAAEIGDRATETKALAGLGEAYRYLGNDAAALAHQQQALALARAIGNRPDAAIALGNLALIYGIVDEHALALEHLQQALALFEEMDSGLGQIRTLGGIGLTFMEQKEYTQAEPYLQRSLALARELEDPMGEAVGLVNLAGLHFNLAQYAEALDYLYQAEPLMHALGDPLYEAAVLSNLGRTYNALGEATQAIVYYQKAIQLRETVLGDIQVEELSTSFAAAQAPLYDQLIDLLWQEGRFAESFFYAEQARARTFLNQLANQPVDFRRTTEPKLIDEEQALRTQIVLLQSALQAERKRSLTQQNEQALTELSGALEQARTAYANLLVRMKLASPEYASLISVDALDLPAVQAQVIDEQTTLIAYFVTNERSFAWVVDRENATLISLAVTHTELNAGISFLRDLIAAQDFDPQTAGTLHAMLFAPLKPYIRHTNLVIVPHDVLHYLPFAALWDAESEHYLIEEYAITYTPSASVLRFILDKRNDDRSRLLALGNPDRSLPNAEGEVRAVAQLYDATPLVGDQATESQIYAQADQIDTLHLAAHGVYDPFHPFSTRIELAADAVNDGNLEVHEVFGLTLQEANLVVLSACETALGDRSDGDEIVGLTRAFIYAGAPAVMTTLWTIDDAASAVLLQAFYQHRRDGLTTAEALRAAQLTVLAQTEWATPYFWAAFTLTGDYR